MANPYESLLEQGAPKKSSLPPDDLAAAKAQGLAAKQQRQLARISRGRGGYRGPARGFRRRFDVLHPYFQQVLEPGRMRAYEQAALGEQRMLRGVDADFAEAGLLDSGAHLFARQGARGYRAAAENQALIDFYEEALRQAIGFAPKGPKPQPASDGGGGGLGQSFIGAGGAALSAYLLGRG